MIRVHRLALPEQLLLRYGALDSAWKVDHLDVSFAPGGDMYTLGWARLADGWDSPMCLLVTRYGREEGPVAAIACGSGRPSEKGRLIRVGPQAHLCAISDEMVALSGNSDETFLIDGELGSVRAGFDGGMLPADRHAGVSFASAMRRTPAGRLVCVVAETNIEYSLFATPNLLAIAETRPAVDHRPILRAFATVNPHTGKQTEIDGREHVLFDGSPVFGDHRPAPSLAESVPRPEERNWMDVHRPPWTTVAEPLSEDLFVLPLFSRMLRSGNKGMPFAFALVDDAGKVHGRLAGLDDRADSPYAGSHFRVATDPSRGIAYHLNSNGFYLWSRDGSLIAKLDTASKEYKALRNFQLQGCAPNGDIVLVHPKQHLLLRFPIPDQHDPGPAVQAALQAYGRERTTLKKSHPQSEWIWRWRPHELPFS
ncbi:hypothetical protein AB0L82_05995 [Nocardia sp. NPDC052001]|uniref:hypothetical protein n=1 Tax=Nocardia sp. NPDC052001 TaxID=3154853 RepID=UPI0034413775